MAAKKYNITYEDGIVAKNTTSQGGTSRIFLGLSHNQKVGSYTFHTQTEFQSPMTSILMNTLTWIYSTHGNNYQIN
jgi:hypothetical protein